MIMNIDRIQRPQKDAPVTLINIPMINIFKARGIPIPSLYKNPMKNGNRKPRLRIEHVIIAHSFYRRGRLFQHQNLKK